jgi:hypothetical protein
MSISKLPTLSKFRHKKLVIIFVASLIITFCLDGIFIFSFFQGFVDFPCFATVENGILDLGGYEDYDEYSHAILFITTYFAHMSGGGCKIVELDNGGSADLGNYHIQVNDDVLTINDEHQLKTGEEFTNVIKRINLNPWYWYEDSFKITNHGYMIGIESLDGEVQELERELLIAIGNMGSREHLNLVTAAIFSLALFGSVILGPLLIIQWIKKKR